METKRSHKFHIKSHSASSSLRSKALSILLLYGLFSNSPSQSKLVRAFATSPVNDSCDASLSSSTSMPTTTTTTNKMEATLKAVRRILPAQRPHWVGNAFNVYPVFADLAFRNELSPFLMFDYAAPKQFPPNEKKRGVGQHPHRGFETVTLAFQGEVEHRDSTGNQDVIGPGDIQWMTAGRGIIHEEYHSTEFAKSGGIFEMCQLWVNLPAKHKMSKPGYQPILQSHVPTVFLPIGTTKDSDESSIIATVRVIAGELNGVKGPAKTFSPVELWDMQVPKKDSVVEVPVKEGHNCIAFVRRGGMEVLTNEGNQKVGPQAVALMERSGTHLKFRTTSADTSILIMGGEPIDEPIAARGPFVMNTHDEIMQANRDFQSGRMGQ